MIWLTLAFPIVTAIVLAIGFARKVTIWEFVGLFTIPVATIAIMNASAKSILVQDTEYWGGYAIQAQYVEDWNERVPCRHAIYCTASCGKDCTYTYVCGHWHSYDVDYHPPYWTFMDSNHVEWEISQQKYNELMKRWGNQAFVDMNRHYHDNDGDRYTTNWDAKLPTVEVTTVAHWYENKVQASHSIFKFAKITKKQARKMGLFEYPGISGYTQASVMAMDTGILGGWDRSIEIINGVLGAKCKARAYVLIWRDKPITIARDQQAYWRGGNKNELIICIGVDAKGKPQWCFPFGWTKLEGVKIDARDLIMKQKVLDILPLADLLYKEIYPNVLRRDFREFAYLVIEPPMWVIVVAFILVVAFCFVWGVWSVQNEFTNIKEKYRGSYIDINRYRY